MIVINMLLIKCDPYVVMLLRRDVMLIVMLLIRCDAYCDVGVVSVLGPVRVV